MTTFISTAMGIELDQLHAALYVSQTRLATLAEADLDEEGTTLASLTSDRAKEAAILLRIKNIYSN
jgi:hypothetical protein